MSKPLIVANWKMNGSLQANAALLAAWKQADLRAKADVAVCASAPYLAQLQAELQGTGLDWGAQDVSAHESGAYTGEVSAAMLRDFACRYVIVGHSERRLNHGETDDMVAMKAQRALAQGLTPIVCVGENLHDREQERTEFVVKRQLSAVIHAVGHCSSEIVVAYEPVWAIGSGLTATPEQAQAVHAVLRAQLRAASAHAKGNKILYGGSMNATNATALLSQPDVDGGLIGGASLNAADFVALVQSVPAVVI